MLTELRLATRRLLADRWAAAGAGLASALGAGLNTAVFAVAYGVLVRPLPYADADRLVVMNADAPYARVDDWRTSLASFAQLSAYATDRFTVYGAGDARVTPTALVDEGFFDTLGMNVGVGRP